MARWGWGGQGAARGLGRAEAGEGPRGSELNFDRLQCCQTSKTSPAEHTDGAEPTRPCTPCWTSSGYVLPRGDSGAGWALGGPGPGRGGATRHTVPRWPSCVQSESDGTRKRKVSPATPATPGLPRP